MQSHFNVDKYINAELNKQSSGSMNIGFPVKPIIDTFKIIYDFIFKTVSPLDHVYNTSVSTLTVIRVLYLLLLVILISLKFLNIWSPTSYALYHGYSIIKLIYYIIIAFSSIFVIFELNDYKKKLFQTLIPMGLLKSIKYLYDINLLVAFSGIIKAYYISSCKYENKGLNPNTYFLINFIKFIFFLFIIIGFVISILCKITQSGEDEDGQQKAKFLIISGIIFYVISFLCDAIENNISININYWSNINSTEDCTTDEDGDNSGFQYIVNILISIVSVFIIIGLCVLQSFPTMLTTNLKIRNTLDAKINSIVDTVFRQ